MSTSISNNYPARRGSRPALLINGITSTGEPGMSRSPAPGPGGQKSQNIISNSDCIQNVGCGRVLLDEIQDQQSDAKCCSSAFLVIAPGDAVSGGAVLIALCLFDVSDLKNHQEVWSPGAGVEFASSLGIGPLETRSRKCPGGTMNQEKP